MDRGFKYYSTLCEQHTDRELVNEEYYGRLFTTYHRTKDLNIVDSIQDVGFIPGRGQSHGRGIYTTLTIDAQFMPNMARAYGYYVIKSKVAAQRPLIFIPTIAKQFFSSEQSTMSRTQYNKDSIWSIENQLRYYGLDKIADQYNPKTSYTKPKNSYAALAFNRIDYLFNTNKLRLHDYFDAVVYSYTGNNFLPSDVVVTVYDEDIITPMSWNSTTFNDTELDYPEWEPIDNKHLRGRSLAKATSVDNRLSHLNHTWKRQTSRR